MTLIASTDGRARALTRLILPVRYRLESIESPARAPTEIYREVTPRSLWQRGAYFTADTAYALYGRPKWLALSHAGTEGIWRTFTYAAPSIPASDGMIRPAGAIRVDIASPGLVLFEPNVPDQRGSDADDPLRVGFLFLDLTLRPETGLTLQLEDLLEFNDLVRMLWPQYRMPGGHSFTAQRYGHLFGRSGLLGQGRADDTLLEDTGYLEWWESALRPPVELKDQTGRFRLVDDDARQAARDWVGGCARQHGPGAQLTLESIRSKTGWLANTDNRAFVWTYACIPSMEVLSNQCRVPKDRPDRIGHWTRFLNVDGLGADYWKGTKRHDAATVTAFERVWAREHTYHRWAAAGSYYGFTPHSGALLFDAANPIPVAGHFETMYFDQILLLLYVRTVTFAFSALVAELGARALEGIDTAGVIRGLRTPFGLLKQRFMSFSTLYQFPLLSTQQQSVEMYDLARRQMDIDALFRDVDKEIDAADQMFAGLVDEAVTNSIHSLTKWGFPVAAMMLILTAFTLIHDSESGKALDTRSWLSMMWPWRWGYALDFLYLCVPFAVLWGLTSLVLWRRNRRS